MTVPFGLLRAAAALCLAAAAAAPAHADWDLPAGASARLGGGTASMGCASLNNGGTLQLQGGALLSATNVAVDTGGTLAIDSGRVELAQQWTNDGTATATTGSVTRTANTGCAVAGTTGPVPLQNTQPQPPITGPQTLALPAGAGGGGSVQLAIAGFNGATLPAGCTLDSAAVTATLPPGAPGPAPLGAFTFQASGCPGATLAISLTYPPGRLAGLTFRKYGPHTVGGVTRTGWFPPPHLSVHGDTMTYTVTDGGDGDSNASAGVIDDPIAGFAMGTAVPTLPGWGLLLLSALIAMLGLKRLPRRPPRCPV
ncbi:MAG: IPTL-CTERM sorting domain-containing protein [Acidovorax sp.]